MTTLNATQLAETFTETMSNAGYGVSDNLFNALKEEFTATLERDKEEGNFTGLDTLLGALEYAANRVYNKVV